MPDAWSWTPDETGLDEDDTPCASCGEGGCEATCTGALLADADAGEDDTDAATS